MPFYMWHATYQAQGTKGVMQEGGTKRRTAIREMVEKAGGKLHALYFAFGDADVVGITEFPDQTTAMAVSMAVSATGLVNVRTTVLVTPEEVDAAAKKNVGYRPPGA